MRLEQEKPMLSYSEMIKHLKDKGIRFKLMDEKSAELYLEHNNNYFKLTAYRKNYPKHLAGKDKDKYIDLDFEYLHKLAVIDMSLRYVLAQMCMDIEHYIKVDIIRIIQENNKNDAYSIVTEYENTLGDGKRYLKNLINQQFGNTYHGELIAKYYKNPPVWVFAEVITFGYLLGLHKFVSRKYNCYNKDLHSALKDVRSIRNATAHNACMINDLHSKPNCRKIGIVMQEISNITEIKRNTRKMKMSCPRLKEIVSLLFVYNKLVISDRVKNGRYADLHKLFDKDIESQLEHFKSNQLIYSAFRFLQKVIDYWCVISI